LLLAYAIGGSSLLIPVPIRVDFCIDLCKIKPEENSERLGAVVEPAAVAVIVPAAVVVVAPNRESGGCGAAVDDDVAVGALKGVE
jgi:hypothetical protein